MAEPGILLTITGTFLLAGTVKGVIGLGLPTVGLALLTVALDLPTAMALVIAPSLVTNLWQAGTGGHGRIILRRLWPFLGAVVATVWIGALALTRVDLSLLAALLGILVVAYAGANLGGVQLSIPPRHERWAAPLAGAVNGVLTGMTGSFVFPGVMFMQAIGLSRDVLIQAMGILFTVSTLALAFALQRNEFLTLENATLSLAALVPAMLGMIAGQWIRRRLSAGVFRRVFFAGLLALGVYIVVSSLAGFDGIA